jgi:hypothetical protein
LLARAGSDDGRRGVFLAVSEEVGDGLSLG